MLDVGSLFVGVDPGPPETVSGVVVFDHLHQTILHSDHESLERLMYSARRRWERAWRPHGYLRPPTLVIETLGYMGPDVKVGASLFDTSMVVGRIVEAFSGPDNLPVYGISRTDVKRTLGLYKDRAPGAKKGDAEVRAALIERFGGQKAIGSKDKPGPLYGITQHKWAALAVAVAAADVGIERLRRLA